MVGGGIGITDQAINPYTDIGNQYELPVGSEINPSDKVIIDKDSPTVILDQWNGESQVSIKPEFSEGVANPKVTATRPLLSKKMQFTQGDETAFVEPSATSSEFNIDITLNSKPASNVFTYTVTGADDLDFFYQPALNESFPNAKGCTPTDCIDPITGVHMNRPENVVGSYAVYSKEKQGHREGATNYGTGKLFNIYRPKATDADGNETWAILDYKSGELSVIVPQQFLDTATYPVIIDPTFGYTTLGGSSLSTVAGSGIANRLGGYTASTGDTIVSFSVGSSLASGSNTMEVAAYDQPSTNATPVNRVAAPVLITINSATPQFFTSSAVSQSLTGGIIYTVAELSDANPIMQYYDTPNPVNASFATLLPNPWSETFSLNVKVSVYATYTTSVPVSPHATVILNNGTAALRQGAVIIN